MTQEPVERGASEEAADSPLTETEVEASRRPPSTGDGGERDDQPQREQPDEQPD